MGPRCTLHTVLGNSFYPGTKGNHGGQPLRGQEVHCVQFWVIPSIRAQGSPLWGQDVHCIQFWVIPSIQAQGEILYWWLTIMGSRCTLHTVLGIPSIQAQGEIMAANHLGVKKYIVYSFG
jgi:hypothetical protein